MKVFSKRRIRFAMLSTIIAGLSTSFNLAQAHRTRPSGSTGPRPVILSELPGTTSDQEARLLSASDLSDAAKHGDQPVVLVASLALSSSDRSTKALFVQLQSARLCGSAGCLTSVYLQQNKSWKLVLDAVSGAISVLPSHHNGMHDLLIDKHDRWTWNGAFYQDGAPFQAPPKESRNTEPTPKRRLLRG